MNSMRAASTSCVVRQTCNAAQAAGAQYMGWQLPNHAQLLVFVVVVIITVIITVTITMHLRGLSDAICRWTKAARSAAHAAAVPAHSEHPMAHGVQHAQQQSQQSCQDAQPPGEQGQLSSEVAALDGYVAAVAAYCRHLAACYSQAAAAVPEDHLPVLLKIVQVWAGACDVRASAVVGCLLAQVLGLHLYSL